MADTKTVRFTRDYQDHRSGQDATLQTAEADALIAQGVAEATGDTADPGTDTANAGEPPAQGLTDGKGQPLQPGFSNSPPAAEQDGIAGQRARDVAPAPGVVKRPR